MHAILHEEHSHRPIRCAQCLFHALKETAWRRTTEATTPSILDVGERLKLVLVADSDDAPAKSGALPAWCKAGMLNSSPAILLMANHSRFPHR